jgi:hypothetical protein
LLARFKQGSAKTKPNKTKPTKQNPDLRRGFAQTGLLLF